MGGELEDYKKQRSYIDEIRHILQQKEPSLQKLVDLSLHQERMKNEQRSLKIMNILKNKDVIINSLKSKLHQYEQSSSSLRQEVQQFNEYKEKSMEEIEHKRNLFKLNNDGKDVQHILEYKQEIDRLNSEVQNKLTEINDLNIGTASLKEQNQFLQVTVEQLQKSTDEKDVEIKKLKDYTKQIEEKNQQQKSQVDQLVERVTILAEDNSKSCTERSKNIEMGESYISKVNALNEELQKLKDVKTQLEKECNSVKEIHLSFLETCNHAINPDLQIGEDYDIEFVQNGILNNINDLRDSISNYQKRHEEDRECLEQMEQEIYKIQTKISGKKYSSKIAQTEIYSEEFDNMTDQIMNFESEYQKVINENNDIISYVQELKENLVIVTQERDDLKQTQNQSDMNKKHVKSTTSLAYSNDEDHDNNELRFTNKQLSKHIIQREDSSPTFKADDKENMDSNISCEEVVSGLNSHRLSNFELSNTKRIKAKNIKYTVNKNNLSGLQNKDYENQVLIVEQRNEIENLRKQNLTLENKLNYELRNKNHSINTLENKIETLQSINSKLKRSGDNNEKDNLQHYIEKLELSEVSLNGELQEALKEKEAVQNYNDELIDQINHIEEVNLALKNKLDIQEINIDEESTINILSSKVSHQKNQIRDLQGSLEKYKDKYEDLLNQLNQKYNEYQGNDLLQSQLSCSLGLSKGPVNRAITPIESLVNQSNPIKVYNEVALSNSLLHSLHNSTDKLKNKNKGEKKGLNTSDLEASHLSKRVCKDDNDLLLSNTSKIANESLVEWLRVQKEQQEKLANHLASECQHLISLNNELNTLIVDIKQEHIDKINEIYSKFDEEKQLLIQEKKEIQSKFSTAKLDVKLQYKEDKIKQLEQRISGIRDEYDSQLSKYKTEVKQLKYENKEYGNRFMLQQDELDQLSASVIDKQTQIDILTDTIQTVQSQNEEELLSKFLDQNASLCSYETINKKLEYEVQL